MSADYYKVRNRETLCRLESGMEITRATKHEPIDFDGLSKRELERLTNDYNGSKFLPTWPLERVVEWTAEQIDKSGWRFPPGAQERVQVDVREPVGYVDGRLVSTVTVMVSGRWVHAFPDEDRP
jgi:hypothetical protein